MAVGADFQAFVLDLLAPLGPSARRLFGGVGLLREGRMFALLSSDTLYFRVDDATRARFRDAGSVPFGYRRAGREVSIETYYQVPETLYDQPEALVAWARDAVAVAQRGAPARRRARAG